jgi:hypothetical protein
MINTRARDVPRVQAMSAPTTVRAAEIRDLSKQMREMILRRLVVLLGQLLGTPSKV